MADWSWRDDGSFPTAAWPGGSEARFTSCWPSLSYGKGIESKMSSAANFVTFVEDLGTSNASSELSAVLDALLSSSESAGDKYNLALLCNFESSFTSLKTESCLSSHKAASSLLSTHSTPLKSSWTLEKASIGNPPFSSPFKIAVGAFGGEMLSTSPNKTWI